MSQPDAQTAPNYVTCPCQHCGGKIEFDANQLDAAENITVPCPHCELETLIFVPELKVPPIVSNEDFHLRNAREVEREEELRKSEAKAQSTEYLRSKREQMTPKEFADFIGQDRIKARLELAVAAARLRTESLGHILLVGTSGSGKATLASVIAKAMGANVKATSGATIEKAGDLAGLLTNLEEGDVLFIDEIHRLRRFIEEYLYPATKDFTLDIIIDQGPNARSARLNLPRFTLIGSTTTKERLTPNLLSCFRIIENMDEYSIEELATIARRFATVIKVEIDTDATYRIARSADGTPIDVLNRLQHVSDFAHVNGNGKITLNIAEAALKMLASSDEKEYVSDSRDAIPSAVRREVWRRDGGKCARCGSRKNLEYDHIIPVSKGGSNTARNIELLCETCNRSKSASIQ